MKKTIALISVLMFALIILPAKSFAAGISVSGGGIKTVGQSFTVSITASGASFYEIEGSISVSGPVSISAVNAGSADVWTSKPSANGNFAGAFLGHSVSSFTIATITLKGTSAGSGSVSVSGTMRDGNGNSVGSGSSSASFAIQKAPDLPGAPTVTSPTHPDPSQSYEATTITLNWNKDSGVDGFSYLLDQTAGTTPSATITNANTTISYPNEAVGTYYFHIRAHKSDGWGATTTFQINIKAPSPKVNTELSKPSDIKITKASDSKNDISAGTFSGIIISGTTLPNYTANVVLTPAVTPPAGKILSAGADKSGNFSLNIDWPIPAGHYALTVQGQNALVLTPVSDSVIFEISQAKGGAINVLTSADNKAPAISTPAAEKWYQKLHLSRNLVYYIGIGVAAIIVLAAGIVFWKKKK